MSGDKQTMAGSGTTAVGGKAAGHMPKDRDGEKKLAGADGFPADHGHTPATRGRSESAIDAFEPGGGFFIRATSCQEGGTWRCAGGGKIAEGTGEGFSADEGSRGGAKKMNPLHHGVGF
jgi:hypothetical protein